MGSTIIYIYVFLFYPKLFVDIADCVTSSRKPYDCYCPNYERRKRCLESIKNNDTNVSVEKRLLLNNIHVPLEHCHYKREIKNMITFESTHGNMNKNYVSHCLKCVACIAVAEKIHETVGNIRKKYPDVMNEEIKPEVLKEFAMNLLEDACNEIFRNYGLRQLKGYIVLTEKINSTLPFKNDRDEIWREKLQQMCHKILGHVTVERLKTIHETDVLNTVDFVCKNQNTLKSCIDRSYKVLWLAKDNTFVHSVLC